MYIVNVYYYSKYESYISAHKSSRDYDWIIILSNNSTACCSNNKSQQCYNHHTQEKLLTESTVNLDCFVQIMQVDESAHASSAAIHHESVDVATVHQQRTPQRLTQQQHSFSKSQPASNHTTKLCMGCGQMSHRHKDRSCPMLNKTCSHCHHLHHFSSVCRKRFEKKPIKSIKVNAVHITPPEIQVQATLVDKHNSVLVTAMVDTGSAISTIDDQTLQRFSSSLHPSHRHEHA